jgi:hypothetical protein
VRKKNVTKKTAPEESGALDFPDAIWEKSGSKEYERLKEKRTSSKKKLNALEEYLCLKYFPAQQKRIQKVKQSKETERENQRSAEQAKQARKEKRKNEQDEFYARKV